MAIDDRAYEVCWHGASWREIPSPVPDEAQPVRHLMQEIRDYLHQHCPTGWCRAAALSRALYADLGQVKDRLRQLEQLGEVETATKTAYRKTGRPERRWCVRLRRQEAQAA